MFSACFKKRFVNFLALGAAILCGHIILGESQAGETPKTWGISAAIDSLKGKDKKKRIEARDFLLQTKISNPTDVDRLVALLSTTDEEVAIVTTPVVAKIGDKIVPTILRLLDSEDIVIQVNACRVLENLKTKLRPGTKKLTTMLYSKEPKVRYAALGVIWRHGDRDAIDSIMAMLETEKNVFVASAAISAVCYGFDKPSPRNRLIPIILKQIRNPLSYDYPTKDGQPDYSEERYYRYPANSTRSLYREQLTNVASIIGEPMIPGLVSLLKETGPSPQSKASALFALGNIITTLEDVKKKDLAAIIEPVLIPQLHDESDLVVLHATILLGKMGANAEPALSSLKKAMDDKRREVFVRQRIGVTIQVIEADILKKKSKCAHSDFS